MSRVAPVAVFAYERAGILASTLHALEHCQGFEGRRVHVFCDQAASSENQAAVDETRRLAAAWCSRHGARLVERERNHHFANITAGLTELTESEGWVISLEDDHLPAPGFLAFLDRALPVYRNHERLFQIAAWAPGRMPEELPETFFLPMPMPTGWATWRRAWRCFSWEAPGASELLSSPKQRCQFDFEGAYPASRLLARACSGDFQSYFIRWYLAMFREHGLALVARTALVYNAGLESGVHARKPDATRSAFFNANWNLPAVSVDKWTLPAEIAVQPEVFARFQALLRAWRSG